MPPRPFPFPFRVGTDICNVQRVRSIITPRAGSEGEPLRPLRHYLKRVFTEHERQYFWNRFGPEESVLEKADVISKFLAGRFAAKEACRKAIQHLDIVQRGFKHIMILPVTAVDRSKHQSLRPQGLILDMVYEDFEPTWVKPDGKIGVIDMSEIDGQLCEISISHDGDYATAVAIVPMADKWER
ncbi:hypothetical protein J4E93_006586 [Alternaria ventricosa]|uniref:uncharacterized protein n=1 Tax=Alternaria ventricosa TaxID=1187951 RepID=UPI0020C1C22F|nr:uncharacterized protein J4E93_006586 [Alternaria ventricosa]KAI4643576.1 hypothetical protein J4E93_006586 [Alternaria ventricosa]